MEGVAAHLDMTAVDDHLVVFTPSGRRGQITAGTTVLDAARQLGVDLDSVCGGRGICGRCQVEPMFGEFSKHGITAQRQHLSVSSIMETNYQGRRPLLTQNNLACAATVCGDLVIDVPTESQVHQQVIRKEIDLGRLELDPVLVLRLIEIKATNNDNPQELILEALEEQWGLTTLTISPLVSQEPISSGLCTVAIRDDHQVVAHWPGLKDQALGIAIDVGSTTIAAHLCDLATGDVLATAGTMNPQIRFGEDLMSRVSYVMMNPGGDTEMTTAVRQSLNDLIGELCQQIDVSPHHVLEMVLVGNPVMHHLFLGIDPIPLGQAPFILGIEKAVDRTPQDLDLDIHPAGRIHVLPCIAGHVGADTAAVILATRPQDNPKDQVTLVVDVGTNAEILLAGKGRLLAASSPTGPAFEGAQITAGQRATPGAIERVRIDPETGEPRIRVLGVDPWSDEPGFVEAVAPTGVTGICGSGIIEVVAELFLAGLMDADGVIGGAGTRPSFRIEPDGRTMRYVLHDPQDGSPPLVVTQNDIRAIQLAKSALYAGIRLLMDHLEVDHLDHIELAGAFGSHIDTLRATVLGLIPDCLPDQVRSVGNAAGAGAVIALLSGAARQDIQRIVTEIEKIETATEPAFQAHFIDAMAIPHRTALYPGLSTRMTLPERTITETGPRRRRRHTR
ncbi:MAG: ASKHA domain-containing protein [Acidimicrobiales bacterium]